MGNTIFECEAPYYASPKRNHHLSPRVRKSLGQRNSPFEQVPGKTSSWRVKPTFFERIVYQSGTAVSQPSLVDRLDTLFFSHS